MMMTARPTTRLLLLIAVVWTTYAFGQERLTVLHWNDFHSQNLPLRLVDHDTTSPWVGGLAVFKAYVDSMRAIRPYTMALHGGDEFQGNPISTLTRGRSQIPLLNLLRPDAFELGNHEFDYGRENVEEFIRQVNFPVLAANLIDSLKSEPFARPFVIRRVGDLRVAIIGLIVEDLYGLTLPRNVRGLRVDAVDQTVRRYLDELRGQADLFFVLSHIGFRADSLLAVRVPELDVIVGGHSHTPLFEPREVNGVIIVQAGSRSRYLGVLDLWVDPETREIQRYEGLLLPTYVDRITPDRRAQAVVDSLNREASSELNRVIGTLVEPWVRNYRGESNVGNWQADVIRSYTEADIAFQNSGGIRKGLPAGPIRVRDMWEMNPFSNYFVVFPVTGRELRQILEKQVSSPKEFLQVSGLRYRYDLSLPVGQRVVDVSVGGQPLDPNKSYRVATNNYVLSHFEKFFGIPRGERPIEIFSKLDREVFIEAVDKEGTIRSRVEGRVVPISVPDRSDSGSSRK
jgi:2',3'-cyclic-nucleotide 2'-phosphodiesterase (5'-nucleotidase family)